MLTQFLIFGVSGWTMEIIWTGLVSLRRRNFKLTATTSIWMFFIYGLAAFAEPICDALIKMPLLMRGGVYTVCIFLVEYIAGICLKKVKICPWDYNGCRFAVKGVIRLDFAPAWFMAGLIFERLHVILRGVL